MTLWTPAALSTVKMWLKGDALTGSTGDPISTWSDASGNSNNGTQTGSNRPTLQTAHQNGLNVVRFTAASAQSFVLPNAFTGYSEASVALILRDVADPGATGTQDHGPFKFGSGGLQNHYPYGGDSIVYDDFASNSRRNPGNPTATLAAYHLLGFRSKSGQWQMVLDGATFNNSLSNTVAWTTTPRIGTTNGSGNYFDGYMGEVVFLNEYASTSDWQKVEGYLAWKWNTVSRLDAGHPYKSAAPTIPSVVININRMCGNLGNNMIGNMG